MSKIQISELNVTNSELSQLGDLETGAVVGGDRAAFRNQLINQIVTNVQINNNVNVQIAFGGDNFNIANLTNNAGVGQSA